MMKIHWMHTNHYYHQIINAPEMAVKEQLYRDHFGGLFRAMQQSAPHIPVQDDVIETARAWNLLLPEDLIAIPDSLRKLEAVNAWTVGRKALEEGAVCFASYSDRITVNNVTGWLILTDSAKAEPSNRGYTGFQFPGHIVGIFDTPNDYNLSRLPGLVVHELHHIIRLGLFPWNMQQPYSVADYVILEGLAESFAAALYGDGVVGYYATDISDNDLVTARGIVGAALEQKGDIRGYIFGDHFAQKWHFEKVGMPPFGGYAVGYRAVQAYLQHTGKTIEEATFLPAREIAAKSRYFD